MLYGSVNVTPKQEVPKYFENISKELKQMQVLKEAEKAQEEAAKAGMGSVPLVSSATMFDSHSKAWQKAAQQLKQDKNQYMETAEGREEYSRLLSELEFGIQESQSYFKEANPILERNLNIARSGQNFEAWDQQGMKDSHDKAYYEGVLNNLDSDRFDVRIEDGHFVLDDGTGAKRVEDPGLMDFSIVKEDLTMTDPVQPDDWWVRSHDDRQYKDRDEAKNWTRATVGQTQRGNLDVARWYVGEGMAPEGMTAEEVANTEGRLNEALDAYAEAAVPEGWTKEDPNERSQQPTAEEAKKKRFDNSLGQIIPLTSDNATSPQPAFPGAAIPPPSPDGSQYNFPSQDYVTVSTSTWGDDAVRNSNNQIQNVSITGIRYDTTSSTGEGLVAMTSSGDITLAPGTSVYESIRISIDRSEGDGAFDKIVSATMDAVQ